MSFLRKVGQTVAGATALAAEALAALLTPPEAIIPDLAQDTPREAMLAELARRSKAESPPDPVEGKTRYAQVRIAGIMAPAAPVAVTLLFTEDAPYAVTIYLHVNGMRVRGVTSREAMLEAVQGKTVAGIATNLLGEDGHLYIGFTHSTLRDKGIGAFRVAREEVIDFLASTHALVPIDSESVDWAIEAEHLGVAPEQLS